MRGHQPFLDVHASAHLGGGTEQNADTPGVHITEQLCLSYIRTGVVNEGYFFRRNPPRDKFASYVVIDGELAGRHGDDLIHIDDTGKSILIVFRLVLLFRGVADKRAVHVYKRPGFQILPFAPSGCRSLSSLGRGQIAEDKLRTLVGGSFTPDFMNTFNSGIELGVFKIIGGRLYQPVIKPRFSGIIGDFERIVDARVWRKILHTLDDLVHIRSLSRGAFHHIIIRLASLNRRRQRPFPGLFCLCIKVGFCHHIGKSPIHGQQFRHVLELGEAAF